MHKEQSKEQQVSETALQKKKELLIADHIAARRLLLSISLSLSSQSTSVSIKDGLNIK